MPDQKFFTVIRREHNGDCKNCGQLVNTYSNSILILSQNATVSLCDDCLKRLETALKDHPNFSMAIFTDLLGIKNH